MHESKNQPNAQTAQCPFNFSEKEYSQRWDLLEDYKALCPQLETESHDLSDAARLAWRNSTRCISRALWKTLKVNDARHLDEPDDIFEALVQHLRNSTRGGDIQSSITVFRAWHPELPEIRVWNHQLIRYAGYEQSDGSVLGDPMNRELTRVAEALGWQPPHERSRFDLLPLILQVGEQLRYYPLPSDAVIEVNIRHPEHQAIEHMALRWYANPVISDMIFATGSAVHGCAPFNGYYMLTEIAARDLSDAHRYNLLPEIAEKLDLNPGGDKPLWKDRALLILAEAVQCSFDQAGVRIIDHHRATQAFSKFCQHEKKQGNEIQADWDWMVPPMSSSVTPVFHETYTNQPSYPNFLMQEQPWTSKRGKALLTTHTVPLPENP